MAQTIRLAILGATGMAGREALLHHEFLSKQDKQYAELACVTASRESEGNTLGSVICRKEKKLAQAYRFWKPMECPKSLESMVIDELSPELIASKADCAISALDADIARDIEPKLAGLGVRVFSNASAFRWEPDVPLLIPEVNHQHIELIEKQKTSGSIVCNPNCTTAGYTPLIHALEENGHAINTIMLVTQQALSGKGDAIADQEYAVTVLGNVRDDWTKDGYNAEEWKSAYEPMKILGRIRSRDEAETENRKILQGSPSKMIPIHSQTTRVATQYGHLECIMIDFRDEVDVENIRKELILYDVHKEVANLPSTPIRLFRILDRMPMPKDDVLIENGMAVVVGDIRQHTPKKISLWTLTHNLRRGATWAGRQGIELYLAKYKGMF
ncbi:aspartate-semialdehyde dehydrogenase [Candidatus Woesearchaeota archaeon]|nr:aspartate-semialdehyde dehydrogenase [Candidatus Woesearchaeota archaeon]